MSSLSKVALAIAVSVAACSDTPVAPPQAQASGIGGSVALSAPTDLRAADAGIAGGITISWSSTSGGVGGYLVERAQSPTGTWSMYGYTRATYIGDALVADQSSCYRVAAIASSPQRTSPPSATYCISRSAQGVLMAP